MAELADAMDLGSIGTPVQVRPLLSAPQGHTQKERTKLHRMCLFLCKTGANCRFYGSLPFLLFLRISPSEFVLHSLLKIANH